MRNDARPLGDERRGYRTMAARVAYDASRRDQTREPTEHRGPRTESHDRQRRRNDKASEGDKKPFITDRDPGDEEPVPPSSDPPPLRTPV